LAQKIDIIVDGQMLRCVTQRTERSHDIGFGFPFFRFQLIAEILIDFRRACAIEQDENLELLLHDFVFSVIPTEVEESLTILAQPTYASIPEMSRLRST